MKGNITKFILSGVVFFIIFIVLDHSIGWGMKHFEDLAFKKNPFSGDMLRTRFICDEVNDEVLIMGSSRALHHYIPSIIEENLKKSVFNCGKRGRFFLYQTAVIDCILNRYSPKLIVWDMESPLAFGMKEPDDFARLSILNSYYDTNQYVNRLIQSKSNCEKYKMYLKLYRYNTHIFHYCAAFLLKSKGIPEGKGYIPLYGIKENLNQPKQMYIEDICYQENVELFKHVLEICSQKKVPLVISFSPRFTDDNAFDTIQYKKLLEVASEYNVPIIDFYHHPDFMSDSNLFCDAGHLNDDGAKIFTERFCEELEKLEILKSAQTNN